MKYQQEIEMLESEWTPDEGFFWRVRQGHFSAPDFTRALQTVSAISVAAEADVPVRLVSLLWYIPLFMQWQVERVQECGGDMGAYAEAITAMTNELERVLGVP